MSHRTCTIDFIGMGLGLIALFSFNSASAATEPDAKSDLPLKKVVLFSSGVGYFQHDGQVTGNAKVEKKFKTDHVNDLLKSLVVEDLDGGHVSTVGYGSKEPISKALQTFSIDLTKNPTLGDLLNQVRGEKVRIDGHAGDDTIVGVEKRKKQVDKDKTVEVEVLVLLTDRGLSALPLDSISAIKLSNEKLDAELRQALAILATAHQTDKKGVTFDFLGDGKRRVRMGYIQETPIWKTSYRLVLTDDKAPFLQGWAIVENTTEDDWSSVALTLVSGRPISFTMDLYQPLFVARPEVQLQLYGSLRPQVYQQDLAQGELAFRAKRQTAMGRGAGPASHAAATVGAPAMAMAGAYPAAPAPPPAEAMERKLGESLRLEQGVQSLAEAGNVGELFQYAIATPVSIARQQSAMLPIVNEDVKGEKVSIYNPQVQAKHPLNGLRLTNSTKLNLMQGPITVFDGGVYAGDAQIEDLAPGSERLLSYALDLDTEVARQSKDKPQALVSLRLVKGTMIVTHKFIRQQEYTVKNSGHKSKKVLIEYTFDPQWTLVAPAKPEEKTRDRYRFAVEAKPGEPAKLDVEEERIDRQEMALTNIDDGTIAFFVRQQEVSNQVKTALQEVAKRKAELNQVTAKLQQNQTRTNEISQEQERIRQNMAQLERGSDLFNRYVGKFAQQEDEIERLRAEASQLRGQEQALRKALDDYLMGLDVG